MRIKVIKTDKEAKIPERAHDTDAGFDLFSLESKIIKPHYTEKFRTGIRVQLDETGDNLYCIRFCERSSLGSKGIGVRAGVIDFSYTGELIVCLTNHNDHEYEILKGDKIVQFIVQKVETPYVLEVDSFEETDRGSGAFGSTGR